MITELSRADNVWAQALEEHLLRVEESLDSYSQLWNILRLAFPQDQHLPTIALERFEISLITRRIRQPLGFPEFCVRRRHYSSISAVVHMKKAAMYINYLTISNEYDVGFSGKILVVQSISISQAMNNGSDDRLRTSVAAAHPRQLKPR